MCKDYQKTAGTGMAAEVLVVPDVVSVAMSEIAADVREGLLAIAVGAGLQVMAAMMSADVDGLCGPRGRHDPDRTATRHGSEAGSVTLGGRRLPVRRPRVRASDGSGERPVPSYEVFCGTEVLGRKAMEQMLLAQEAFTLAFEEMPREPPAASPPPSSNAPVNVTSLLAGMVPGGFYR